MAQQIVFYSWQSWTDATANRNFIGDCLERAIKEIRKNDSLRLDPVIDRDTQGVPGSADIVHTIFDKIAEADLFVADVSLAIESPDGRQSPNPNVLIELGYALSNLGGGKVICVHNLATGRIEDLPFDIRGRSVVTYELPPKSSLSDEAAWQARRGDERKTLVGKLKHGLIAVLSAPAPALSQFVSEMVEQLVLAIVYGNQVEDRKIKPGSEQMRDVLAEVAEHLRSMSCRHEAEKLKLVQRLEETSAAIEEAVHTSVYLDRESFENFVMLVKRAVELASTLKQEWLESSPLSRSNLYDVHRRLYEMRKKLDVIVSRLPAILRRAGGYSEACQATSDLGLELCRYGQFDLDSIHPGLAASLSTIGRKLHLVGVSLDYSGGTRGIQRLIDNLNPFATEFGQVVDSLPRLRELS